MFQQVARLGFELRGRFKDEDKLWDITHSRLPLMPESTIPSIVEIVRPHPLGPAALRPLLLLESLPARDVWAASLEVEPQGYDWETLGDAVLKAFDHQSEEATDVRWMRVIFSIAFGRMIFTPDTHKQAEEFIEYPRAGDSEEVRASIRAAEIGFQDVGTFEGYPPAWGPVFWDECLKRTACIPADVYEQQSSAGLGGVAAVRAIQGLQEALLIHWIDTLESTAVDPRRDATFGFGFYAMACMLELAATRLHVGIAGRALLRILAESRITLAFLRQNDDDELWAKFRKYGAGQAKLALLKVEERGVELGYAASQVLEGLANEDFWQEFVPIDLGHWAGVDLRRMAEASGTKDVYDLLYGWPSSFVHGHWGAIRDACMVHCANPLHRFHRVPRLGHREFESTLMEGARLLNDILDDVSALFPEFEPRLGLVAEEQFGSADADDAPPDAGLG